MEHGPSFIRDGRPDTPYQVRIPGSRQSDCLRIDGCPAEPGHPVQAFTPPVVGWYVQPVNGCTVIDHLGDLLFQGHPGNEVGHAIINGLSGILPDLIIFSLFSSPGAISSASGKEKYKNDQDEERGG